MSQNIKKVFLLSIVSIFISVNYGAAKDILKWNAVPTNIDGYIVSYGTAPNNYTQHKNVGNVTQYDLSVLPLGEGVTYYFAVQSYRGQDTSTYSEYVEYIIESEEIDTTPPLPPLLKSATAVNNTITMSWQANGESDLAGYRVYYGLSSRVYKPYIPVDRGTLNYTFSVEKEGGYFVSVTAFDLSGNESGFSNEIAQFVQVPPLPDDAGQVSDLMVHWKCDSLTLDTYQVGDGNTVMVNGANFIEGKSGNGVDIQAGQVVYFKATHGNNINLEKGSIAFWYRKTGTITGFSRFFQLGDQYTQFSLYRFASDNAIRFYDNGSQYNLNVTPNVFDGEWHHMNLVFDRSKTTAELFIDYVSAGSMKIKSTPAAISGNHNFYLGNESSGLRQCGGIIDEFSIFSTPSAMTETPPDTILPEIRIELPDSDGTFATNLSKVSVSGVASDNAGIKSVNWKNSLGGNGSADGTESWKASDITLAEGDNIISVTVVDTSGNEASTSITVIYTVPDTIKPVVSVKIPTGENSYETSESSIDLSGTASDNIGVKKVFWTSLKGGSGDAIGLDNWSISELALQEGTNIFTIMATDEAGNTGSDTLTVIYTPPPSLSGKTVHWACDASKLDTYQDGDGSTVTVKGANFVAGKMGNGVDIHVDQVVSFTAAHGKNIDLEKGSIGFWYKKTGTTTGFSRFFQYGDEYNKFSLYRFAKDSVIRFYDGGTQVNFNVATNVYDGKWHHINLVYDRLNTSAELYIDNTLQGNGRIKSTLPSVAGNLFYVGNDMTGLRQCGGTIDEFYISNAEGAMNVEPVDTVLPEIKIVSPAVSGTYPTSLSTVAITGAASDNAEVKSVNWKNSRGGSGAASGTESWQIADIKLYEGDNIITVTATDTSDNESSVSITVSYTIPDTVPPVVSIKLPTDTGIFQTSEANVNISGSASDNIEVKRIIWKNSRGGSGAATGTVSWKITDVKLYEGDNIITVTATDTSDNESSAAITVNYTIPDTVPPVVSIKLPTDTGSFQTSEASVNISGTASDNIGVQKVRWLNSKGTNGIANGTDNWTISNLILQEGVNVITVSAVDEAGNIASGVLTITYTIPDTQKPVVAVVSPTKDAVYKTDQLSIDLSGMAADNIGVLNVSWSNSKGGDGTATGTENWTVSGLTLQKGTNVITFSAADEAGNTGTCTLTITCEPVVSFTGILTHWKCDASNLDTSQPGDGSSVTIDGANFVEGKAGNGVDIQTDQVVYFSAMHGSNINLEKGSVSFWYKKTGEITGFSRFFQLGDEYNKFSLYRFANDFVIRFYDNGSQNHFNVTTNIYDGEWHYINFAYDRSVTQAKLYIDNVLEASVKIRSAMPDISGSNNLYIGNDKSGRRQCGGIIDELFIKK